MNTFFIALTALLSVLTVITISIVMKRMGRISLDMEPGMLRLVVDVLIPCIIIDKVLKTDAFFVSAQNLWLPPILGFSTTGIGILLGFTAAYLCGKKLFNEVKQRRTFAACIGLLNYGYVPIPLLMMLFPDDDRIMGVFFLQYLGCELSVWTLVVFTMMGGFNAETFRKMFNAPSITLFAAVILNLLGHSSLFPDSFLVSVESCFDFLFRAIHQLGQAMIPVSLMMVGLTISELIAPAEIKKRWKTSVKTALLSCVLRLLVMPSIFLTLAVLLPCTVEIKRILVIHGAMGSAIFPIVLAKHYNGDPETAFDTVMSNTFLSILTLPFWIAFGLQIVSA
jgi:predicted permease